MLNNEQHEFFFLVERNMVLCVYSCTQQGCPIITIYMYVLLLLFLLTINFEKQNVLLTAD